MTSAIKTRYLSQLKKALPCSGKHRAALMIKAQSFLTQYLQENPEATYTQLIDSFGKPEEFAGVLLEDIDPEEVDTVRRNRRAVCNVTKLGKKPLSKSSKRIPPCF